jgi:hypothetical protein
MRNVGLAIEPTRGLKNRTFTNQIISLLRTFAMLACALVAFNIYSAPWKTHRRQTIYFAFVT